MKSIFFNPTRVVNVQSIGDAGYLAKYRDAHCLIVTTKGGVQRGIVDGLVRGAQLRRVTVIDVVLPNPDIADIDTAHRSMTNTKVDVIIAVGGGSVIDFAKALSVLLSSRDGDVFLAQLRAGGLGEIEALPLIAIPTTAGTGSEVTPFATVWDRRKLAKYSIDSEKIYPAVAVLCTSLLSTLDGDNMLWPAMDALSHCAETLWNRNSSDVSRGIARAGIDHISSALHPSEQSLRQDQKAHHLQMGAMMGGLAISQNRTAIAHALSYSLTLRHGMPHGLACSFLLPTLATHVLRSSTTHRAEAEALGKVRDLVECLGVTERVFDYVEELDAEAIVRDAFISPRAKNFTVEISERDLVEMIRTTC